MNAHGAPARTTRTATLTLRGVVDGAREIAPVAIFVIPFGIAFGAAAIEKGLSAPLSVLMSTFVFAGASQFAALDLWASPMPYLMLALTVFAVNARHILLGAALAPWLLHLPMAKRYAVLSVLSDPNWAQATRALQRGETDAGLVLGSGLLMWIAWIIATAIGAVLGSNLGDLTRFGFDVLMIAFFAAAVVGQWRGLPDLVPWLVAATVALAGAWILPFGWHVVAGALAGGITGALRHG
ncbi:AzlC family ABC transporter permease [Chelatococcus daeguensis]|uniref:Predicted branched-chain amino acid permease (Azaleucine resistance) n=1 Tax=Chelatococcus sambhunathii TaxID=363953 RepID=A0ABM9U1W2_9HYPH|nr:MULTISPECIES: AzlC family ABC transporter permease [Chelatococcus]KZE27385.1 branched-chain amino acid ABC transporter permease [Chelatococcus daeguensis]MBM3085595.1 AzlC family ABC transporter permease [Chelatococcus daeguensis]CUA84208.1 Predicted branched-chain amino acid permease (azaleucine resistance) [Chelatococcus sambhunathii]